MEPPARRSVTLCLVPVLIIAFATQGTSSAQQDEGFSWTEPYGRYSLVLDGPWFAAEGVGLFGERNFARRAIPGVPLEAQVDVEVRIAAHPAQGTVAAEMKRVEQNPLLVTYGEVLSKTDATVCGRKARLIEFELKDFSENPTQPEIERTDYVLIRARDSVLRIEFSYDGNEIKRAKPIIQAFLAGVRIPDEPSPAVRLDRGKVGFQVTHAVRVSGKVDPAVPVTDTMGLVSMDEVPDGWKLLLHRGRRNPLEGLAFEQAETGLRVYLCPLPIEGRSDGALLDPLRDMQAEFRPLRSLPCPDPPKTGFKTSGSEAFLGKLGDREGREGGVWRLLLHSGPLTVLVICTWEADRLSDAPPRVHALLRAVQLNSDRVAMLPGGVCQYVWEDHFKLMSRATAKATKAVHTYLWTFTPDGGFNRESYSGVPGKRVAEEGGKCALIDDRFLFLLFDDGTMEILPMEIYGDGECPMVDLDFRGLDDHPKK